MTNATESEESTSLIGTPPGSPDGHAKILLVDDRQDKLLALEVILASLGQDLILVRSGAEALRFLLKQDVAVIVLDVSMPGMDGFETASLIRQRKGWFSTRFDEGVSSSLKRFPIQGKLRRGLVKISPAIPAASAIFTSAAKLAAGKKTKKRVSGICRALACQR